MELTARKTWWGMQLTFIYVYVSADSPTCMFRSALKKPMCDTKTFPHRLNLTSDPGGCLLHHLVTPLPPASMLKATLELVDLGKASLQHWNWGDRGTREQRGLTLSLVDGWRIRHRPVLSKEPLSLTLVRWIWTLGLPSNTSRRH